MGIDKKRAWGPQVKTYSETTVGLEFTRAEMNAYAYESGLYRMSPTATDVTVIYTCDKWPGNHRFWIQVSYWDYYEDLIRHQQSRPLGHKVQQTPTICILRERACSHSKISKGGPTFSRPFFFTR